MLNEKNDDGSERPLRQCLGVSYDQGSKQIDLAAGRIDGGRSADTVKMSKSARKPDGSTSAARLRRCSRLPRPTASASNGVVDGRRDDDAAGVRRTRRLSTLRGVVLNSSMYSAARPTACLVASIISKCRIPAPVTTRRISSWTDGWESQTAASPLFSSNTVDRTNIKVSEYHSRIGSLTLNIGDPPAIGVGVCQVSAAGTNISGMTTPELKYSVRFSPDSGKQHRDHVCCGCAGKGLVSSHLLCVRSSRTAAEWDEVDRRLRRTSPRVSRVYRFDASARHRVAVAQVAVEAGLQLLPSQPRCHDSASDNKVSQTVSGSVGGHKHNSNEQAASGQVNDELQLGKMTKHALVIGKVLPDSQVPEVVALDQRSSAETGSKQKIVLSSKPDSQQPETTAARLSTISGIPRLNSIPEMCRSPEVQRTFSGKSDAQHENLMISAFDQQLASASYTVTVTDKQKTTATEATEKSITSQHRKVAKKYCSFGSRLSPVKTTGILEDKSAIIKADKINIASKSPTSSQVRYEPTKRKRLVPGVVDRQNGKKKCYSSLEASQTNSEPLKFVALSGHDVPMKFRFADSGIRRRSPLSVTFADKNEKRRSHRSIGGHKLAARPYWRDLVVAPSPTQRQEYHVATTISTEESPDKMSVQAKNLLSSEFLSSDRSTESAVTMKEESAVKTHSTAVAKAHLAETSKNLYTSEDLVVRKQATWSCGEQGQQQPHSARGVRTATPSFFIGIASRPSLDDYHRKRPVSRTGDSHNVEPTPSFISCSASEKDFPHAEARQKNTAEKPSMRRKTSAAKDVVSTTTHRENRLSCTSKRRSKNQLSPLHSFHVADYSSGLSRQNSNQNKTSSKPKASTIKSIFQRELKSSQASIANAKHSDTSTSAGRTKRPSVAPNVTEEIWTKDLSAGNLHRENQPVEPCKRNGDVNATSHKRPINFSFTSKSGQSKCMDSKKTIIDSSVKTFRTKYISRQFHEASELSGTLQFAVKNAPVLDSKQAKEVSEIPYVPLVHSSCRSDEISNELPSECVKKPVSFFISCPSVRRSRSRTASKTSRIPRPHVSAFISPVKSHSYVVRAPTTPCTGLSGTEQHPSPPERRSANESPSTTSTDLRIPDSRDSVGDHEVDLSSEPQVIESNSDELDSVCIASEDVTVLNCVGIDRHCQDVDDDKPQPAVEENVNQLPDDASPLDSLSADSISTTQDRAVEIKSNEENSRSMSQTTLMPTAATLPQEPSEQSTQLLQLDLSSCSSVLSVEPNLEQLTMNSRKNELQCSSSINQTLDETPVTELSFGEISNVPTQVQAVAVERNKEYPLLISQCTVLPAASVQQERSEHSPQLLRLALSNGPSVWSVEPNTEGLSVEACNSQPQCSLINPVKYIDSADCETTEPEPLMFSTHLDHECPVKDEAAKLDSDALKISTNRPKQRTKSSKKISRSKSDKMSLNIGLEVRLRNFDEVSIELPDVVWSRLQSEEIRYPEVVRLSQSTFEALVLRSTVRQPLQPPSPRLVEHVPPSRRTKLPSRLLATAQTRRHAVESSAALSIKVICSRVDQAVQSADTVFQISPSNPFSSITNDETMTENNTRSDYISAKKYLEQLAKDLASSSQENEWNTSPLPVSKRNKNRQPRNRYHVDDLPIMSKEIDREELEQEEEKANEQAREELISFYSTSAQEVKNKKDLIDVNCNSRPRLRLPCSDLGLSVVRKNEAKEENSDDDQLPADADHAVTQSSEKGDGVFDETLPVLAAVEKRRASGEPCWQLLGNHELTVDQSPRLSSGE